MRDWFSPLLFLLASSSEEELRHQIEFLKAENEMLRKRVPKQRIFLDNEERERAQALRTQGGSSVTSLLLDPMLQIDWFLSRQYHCGACWCADDSLFSIGDN